MFAEKPDVLLLREDGKRLNENKVDNGDDNWIECSQNWISVLGSVCLVKARLYL